MKNYISITIGRNYGDVPMDWATWQNFRTAVRRAIENNLQIAGWLFDGEGLGTWENIQEESHAFIILARHDENDIQQLKKTLGHIAYLYGQDAIGCAIVPLATGEETLITARK